MYGKPVYGFPAYGFAESGCAGYGKPCTIKYSTIQYAFRKDPEIKSLSDPSSRARQDSSSVVDDDAMDEWEYRLTRTNVKEQIEYDALDTPGNHERLEEIVDLIADTLCTRKSHIRIGGENYPAEMVRSRFKKLNMYHIEYVFGSLDKKHTEVRNIRQYLLTALYNAPATMNNYYDAEVRSLGIL